MRFGLEVPGTTQRASLSDLTGWRSTGRRSGPEASAGSVLVSEPGKEGYRVSASISVRKTQAPQRQT